MGQPVDVAQHTQDAQQRQVAEQLEGRGAFGLRTQVDHLAGHALQQRQQPVVATLFTRHGVDPVPSAALAGPMNTGA